MKGAEHGSASTYRNWGCRCDDCREAHRQRVAEQAARRQALGYIPSSVRHGSRSTYANWACRCRPCTDAHAAYHRQHRSAARSNVPR